MRRPAAAVGEVVVGPVGHGAERDDRPRPREHRHAVEAVLLGHPGGTGQRLARDEVRPGAGRDVERDLPVGAHHRRDQDVGAEHVLPA